MCFECGCRLEQVRLRNIDVERAESLLTPEVRAEIIETIAILLSKLIEIGPAVDPQIRAAWRAQLLAALTQLGIDPKKDHWGILYGEMVYQVFHDRQFPKKPAGYPDLDVFSQRVKVLLKEEYEALDDLRGREGKELAEYLYGLGFVMASELSYKFIFPESDPIVVNKKTGEILGRHRYLTFAILEELDFETSRWDWVRIKVE